MNLHPIFVHFPIAFLFMWSVLAIFPFERYMPNIAWREVKLIFLVVGLLGALLGLATGDQAEHIVGYSRLVETHSTFAGLATITYALLLVQSLLKNKRYIAEKISPRALDWLNSFLEKQEETETRFIKLLTIIELILSNKFVFMLLVLVSFIAIIITGVLGGAIAYGPNADPFAKYILALLGL